MADKKFIDEVIKAHNQYRANHQAPPLTHNKELSAHAQKWADRLAETDTFEHSDPDYNGKNVGENIAMKWSSKPKEYSGTLKNRTPALHIITWLCHSLLEYRERPLMGCCDW